MIFNANRNDRGVSEVVALVLITGFVLVVMVGILLAAGSELTGQQTSAEVGQAEEALTQLDSEAYRVASGSSSTQTVDLGLRGNVGTLDVDNESGHITATYVDFLGDENETVVLNESMGTVFYEQGDTKVGYQGGGVFRSDGDGSTMISPPEIAFREKSLTMSIVNTTGAGSVHSDVRIGPRQSRQHFPNSEQNLTNRVSGSQIVIRLQSEFCEGWEQFFQKETDTILQECEQGQEDQLVIMFLALPTDFSPDAGVIATSGPGEIRLEGNGAYIDSYDSRVGPYEESSTSEGIVKAAGNIHMTGDSEIAGDTHGGEDILVDGDGLIDGDAYSHETVSTEGDGEITGNVTEGAANVPDIPPINTLVSDTINELVQNNQNDQTQVIEDNELHLEEENRLEPGEYYLDDLDLQGETLELNVSDGNDITIGVRDYVNLEKVGGDNSHIEVLGDEGNVQLFVGSEQRANVNVPGEGQQDIHFFVERNGTIDVPGDESIRFQIFGPDNFEGAIGGSSSESAKIVASVIAPAGPGGPGEFYLQHSNLYGAVVTGNLTQGQNGQIHFDRALMDEEIPLAPEVPRFEYLYINVHEVEVDGM